MSFEEIYRASNTPPNPEDLVEGNVYNFVTTRGRGQSVYQPRPSYKNATLIRKTTTDALFRTRDGDMYVDLSSIRNLRLVRPRAPILPSPDDRNEQGLAALAYRQLSTDDMHDFNIISSKYEIPKPIGKLYSRQNAGLKSKRRRNKKTKTKRQPSKKTKRK